MSRSFKKTAISKRNTRGMKKAANARVRMQMKNGLELSKGSNYKKVFCSYDICDYKIISEPTFEKYFEKLKNELEQMISKKELEIENYDFTKLELEKINLKTLVEKKFDDYEYSYKTMNSLLRSLIDVIKKRRKISYLSSFFIGEKEFLKKYYPTKEELEETVEKVNELVDICFESLKKSKENLEKELFELPKVAKKDWLTWYKGKWGNLLVVSFLLEEKWIF